MSAGLARGWLPRVLLAVFLAAGAAWAPAQVAVPPLKTRVTDLTGTLTADQRAALEAKLATFETRKGSQVALLIVPSAQPETIEAYSMRVVEQWKLGRKRVDDGVLLIVAKDDHKMRIEVGRGLEGAIPDAIAKRIVAEVIAPRFKEGDFYGGITAGLDRILRTIEGEPLPPPPQAKPRPGGDSNWFDLAVVGIIIVSVLGGLMRAMFGRFLGAGIVGFAAGALGYFLVGLAAAAIIAIIAFLVSMFAGGGRGGGWSSGPGWGGGGFGGGGGGFSGGGGGFSGGGGGFSGGGASGSW